MNHYYSYETSIQYRYFFFLVSPCLYDILHNCKEIHIAIVHNVLKSLSFGTLVRC